MRRNSIALILLVLLLLTGCCSLGKVHTVAVLGKADTDEAVIVVTDVNGRQKSKKIDYPAEEYFGEEAVYYSTDGKNYDSLGYDDLRKKDRIENLNGVIMYHAEDSCTYVYENGNRLAVYKDGSKLREFSLDGMTLLKVEKGLLYHCDGNGTLRVYDVRSDELLHELDASSLYPLSVTTVEGNTYLVSYRGYTLLEDWQLGSTYVYPVQFDEIRNCRGRYITVTDNMELKTYEVSFDSHRMIMSDDIDDDIIGYVNFEKLYAAWYEKGYEVLNFYGFVGE